MQMMAHICGSLPPTWETWMEQKASSWPQSAPALTVAGIWGMNQQVEDISAFQVNEC